MSGEHTVPDRHHDVARRGDVVTPDIVPHIASSSG